MAEDPDAALMSIVACAAATTAAAAAVLPLDSKQQQHQHPDDVDHRDTSARGRDQRQKTAATTMPSSKPVFECIWPREQSPGDFLLHGFARLMAAKCARSPGDGLLRVPLRVAGERPWLSGASKALTTAIAAFLTTSNLGAQHQQRHRQHRQLDGMCVEWTRAAPCCCQAKLS